MFDSVFDTNIKRTHDADGESVHRTPYTTDAIDDAKAKGARVVNEDGGVFCKTLFYPPSCIRSRKE